MTDWRDDRDWVEYANFARPIAEHTIGIDAVAERAVLAYKRTLTTDLAALSPSSDFLLSKRQMLALVEGVRPSTPQADPKEDA